jgi:hypothetical protein
VTPAPDRVHHRPAPRGQSAVERTRTSTTWLLKPQTLPLVYDGRKLARSGLPDRAAPPKGGAEVNNDVSAAERICTSTTWHLGPLTLLVGLRRRDMQGPASRTAQHRRRAVRRSISCGAAERSRTSTERNLNPLTLPLVYGGVSWECQDLHLVGKCDCFTDSLGDLYRQSSLGVIDGTRTRLIEVHNLAPRLLRPRHTVRPGGVAPPSVGYRPTALLLS